MASGINFVDSNLTVNSSLFEPQTGYFTFHIGNSDGSRYSRMDHIKFVEDSL